MILGLIKEIQNGFFTKLKDCILNNIKKEKLICVNCIMFGVCINFAKYRLKKNLYTKYLTLLKHKIEEIISKEKEV